MKLDKNRFTCWECIDDNDYENKFDDELIISIKEGETNRDIADYILECQEKAEKWDKIDDFMFNYPDSIYTAELRQILGDES